MLDLLYLLSFIIPAPFWFLMVVAPRGTFTQRFLRSYLACILLGAAYLFVLVGSLVSGIGFNLSSITSFAAMFSTPASALLIWLHLVALDLAGGYWIHTEGLRAGISISLLRFFLILTFLLGPLGIFLFTFWRLLSSAGRESGVAGAASQAVVSQ